MAYEYKIVTDAVERVKGLQHILGVVDDEFSEEDMDQLPCMPAAELEVLGMIPDYASLQDSTHVKLAVLYFAAANAIPGLQNKMLALESDNRSMAQRLKNAFDKGPDFYRGLANKHAVQAQNQLLYASSGTSIFSAVPPAADEFTRVR